MLRTVVRYENVQVKWQAVLFASSLHMQVEREKTVSKHYDTLIVSCCLSTINPLLALSLHYYF